MEACFEASYSMFDEVYFSVLVEESFYKSLMADQDLCDKFDDIVQTVAKTAQVNIQKVFDSVFGDGTIVVD